MNVKGKVKAVP